MNKICISTLIIFLISISAYASNSETWSIGVLGGITTANESDFNTLISRANTRVGGINTPQFGNAWEFGAFIQRRLNGSIIALELRPTYFYDSVSGNGGSGSSSGTYAYSVNGFTITPMILAYILESPGVHLYMLGGICWGFASGSVQEAGANASYNATGSGFQGGMGVSFCFGSRSQHCIGGEGSYRYLPYSRNIISSSGGSFATGSVSQAAAGTELELDGHDLATTMSGIQGTIQYKYAL